MATFTISETARVRAPARRIYDLLADYRTGHPRVLPPKYFTSLEVESGGVGAGTVIKVGMRLLGSRLTYRAAVTEPEPGRVLAERDLATGLVTSFTVQPIGSGAESDVTISTLVPERPGVRGAIERWVARRMLPGMYREELRLIAAVAEG